MRGGHSSKNSNVKTPSEKEQYKIPIIASSAGLGLRQVNFFWNLCVCMYVCMMFHVFMYLCIY